MKSIMTRSMKKRSTRNLKSIMKRNTNMNTRKLRMKMRITSLKNVMKMRKMIADIVLRVL